MIDRGRIGHKAAKLMKRSKTLEGRRAKALAETQQLLTDVEVEEAMKLNVPRHHAEILLRVSGLGISTPAGEKLFEHLDITLRQGERVAILGPNGSGKSAILSQVTGAYARQTRHGTPEERNGLIVRGGLKLAPKLEISIVQQDLSDLKGDVADFARRSDVDEALFRAILERLDFSTKQLWNREIRVLSDGQKKKMAIAACMSRPTHLYVWDEPLNFLDIQAREQLEEVLTQSGASMLFVEHDEAFIDKVATAVIHLSKPA